MSYTSSDAKQLLCKKIERVVGHIPEGLDDILSILLSDDVYPEFREYMRKIEQEASVDFFTHLDGA